MQVLSSATEVMDALGGTLPVAELTGRKYSAAFNWRAFNRFPPDTFVVMSEALALIGKSAPASLWRMVEAPSGTDQARATP